MLFLLLSALATAQHEPHISDIEERLDALEVAADERTKEIAELATDADRLLELLEDIEPDIVEIEVEAVAEASDAETDTATEELL